MKRKNPLRRRIFREIMGDKGKYLVIFILMIATISFISGYLVADGSMIKAYKDSFKKYKVEDGHFVTEEALTKVAKRHIEKEGVRLYNLSYVEKEATLGATVRMYSMRTTVNLACLMEGAYPAKQGEIAIDRMFADNNQLSVGDYLTFGAEKYKITGLVALPDYSALFENSNDTMFDAMKFGVAVVNRDEFLALSKEKRTNCYSWQWLEASKNEKEEKTRCDALMKVVNGQVELTDYVPRIMNQAINFTGEDLGNDRAMMIVLFYIIMIILAFVFALTTSNTIEKEAGVIGTLKASGFTARELISHYLVAPTFVTLISAVIGNILGYTVLKGVCVDMYYGSYSLPTYVTVWNLEAFVLTTIVPILMMLCIHLFLLSRKMRLSPLLFLRRDLSRKKKKRAANLSPAIPFFSRFRLRVLLQNRFHYVVLFLGIMISYLLLMFGMMLPSILDHYQNKIQENMFCKYQYLLKMPPSLNTDEFSMDTLFRYMKFAKGVQTKHKQAEKFSAYTLQTYEPNVMAEDILIYGLEPKSKYVPLDLSKDDVVITRAYAQKFSLKTGDRIRLKEKYEDTRYSFRITGILPYDTGLYVFMSRSHLNKVFDLGDDMFGGYFSNEKLTDLDEDYVGSIIDLDALTKVCRQLKLSMGELMYLVDVFAMLIFVVMIYILSKTIIEKNAQSISMAKILGYSGKEIARLYLMPTSFVVIGSMILSLPICDRGIRYIWQEMMKSKMKGWLPVYMDFSVYGKMLLLGIVAYGVVALLEMRKISKVPMDLALKNAE
ncbi:putative ABC transport system permease protein [Lachnospiraceae bacterium XBB1006]|nr:putative ABC transport system permease protein [Lachnospiraceae bacterium XBB1006]